MSRQFEKIGQEEMDQLDAPEYLARLEQIHGVYGIYVDEQLRYIGISAKNPIFVRAQAHRAHTLNYGVRDLDTLEPVDRESYSSRLYRLLKQAINQGSKIRFKVLCAFFGEDGEYDRKSMEQVEQQLISEYADVLWNERGVTKPYHWAGQYGRCAYGI